MPPIFPTEYYQLSQIMLPAVKREVFDPAIRTFEQRVEELEQACRDQIFSKVPSYVLDEDSTTNGVAEITLRDVSFDTGQQEKSVSWYAWAILCSITVVRLALKGGDAERAASEAVVLGVLAAEYRAMPESLLADVGTKAKESARKGGLKRGAQSTRDSKKTSKRIESIVTRHASSDERLTIKMIADTLGRNPRTVRRHLEKMGIPLSKP